MRVRSFASSEGQRNTIRLVERGEEIWHKTHPSTLHENISQDNTEFFLFHTGYCNMTYCNTMILYFSYIKLLLKLGIVSNDAMMCLITLLPVMSHDTPVTDKAVTTHKFQIY